MAANSKATEFLSGKIHWAKVLGDPRPNYGGDAREWSFEFEPDEDGMKVLKKHKLTDRLKDKENPDRKVLVLRKSEFNKQGEPNPPIRVYDSEDEKWDDNKLIGNASSADVKLDIRDYGVGKKKGVYPAAIRVTDLVSFQSSEFGKLDEARGVPAKVKASAKKDEFAKDFGLGRDDRLPNNEDPLDDELIL